MKSSFFVELHKEPKWSKNRKKKVHKLVRKKVFDKNFLLADFCKTFVKGKKKYIYTKLSMFIY